MSGSLYAIQVNVIVRDPAKWSEGDRIKAHGAGHLTTPEDWAIGQLVNYLNAAAEDYIDRHHELFADEVVVL